MKTQTREGISMLLALMLAFALFSVMPTAALAVYFPVVIAETDTVGEIQTLIQNAIDGAAVGDTVTVMGSKMGADETLYLDIPEGVTVVWKAEHSGAVGEREDLIYIIGGGIVKANGENGAADSVRYDSYEITTI